MTENGAVGSSATVELAKKPWALINLPALPMVATRILQLLAKDNTGMRELSELIRSDVAFSTEILTLANSALFAFRTEINSILQATALLGLDRVKAIALTVGMRAYVMDALKIPAVLACWRHSLACAVLAEEMASACFVERDVAYLAGLLHDVGRLALTVMEPLRYSNLLLEASEKKLDIREREREMFEVDHCQAGRWLAEQWRLPGHFAEVAARHHDPPKPGKFDIVALVRVACLMADCIGFYAVLPPNILTFQDLLNELPTSALKRFNPNEKDLTFKVAMKINSIE